MYVPLISIEQAQSSLRSYGHVWDVSRNICLYLWLGGFYGIYLLLYGNIWFYSNPGAVWKGEGYRGHGSPSKSFKIFTKECPIYLW